MLPCHVVAVCQNTTLLYAADNHPQVSVSKAPERAVTATQAAVSSASLPVPSAPQSSMVHVSKQIQDNAQSRPEQNTQAQSQHKNQDKSKQCSSPRNPAKAHGSGGQKPSAAGVDPPTAAGQGKEGKSKAQLKAERRAVQVNLHQYPEAEEC